MDISRSIRGRGTFTALTLFIASLHDRATQWQRIALARAFMRAHQPDVHFLLFDEPVRPTRSFSAKFWPIIMLET